jgi:tyrosyl-tRNA synthetase
MNLLEDLKWRGLISAQTNEAGLSHALQKPITLYCGFDPTGDSLHVGHLLGLLTLKRFALNGHKAIALVGGATGLVGDPSGRSQERNLITADVVDHNVRAISTQMRQILGDTCPLLNNADWFKTLNFLEFLRDVGKHFSIAPMLAKDSVKSRLSSENGISFTEFAYQLLQAHDFSHLHSTHQCILQLGGSDQWGNITNGIDLIRKTTQQETFGLTFPLLTKTDGTKFGKTASGAVWLSVSKTSPFEFFQFFMNTEDSKVCELLRKLTFLSHTEITTLETEHSANPGARKAQRALACAVSLIVHGPEELERTLAAIDGIFSKDLLQLNASEFSTAISTLPVTPLNADLSLLEALLRAQVESSKSSIRNIVLNGGKTALTERLILFHKHTVTLLFVRERNNSSSSTLFPMSEISLKRKLLRKKLGTISGDHAYIEQLEQSNSRLASKLDRLTTQYLPTLSQPEATRLVNILDQKP